MRGYEEIEQLIPGITSKASAIRKQLISRTKSYGSSQTIPTLNLVWTFMLRCAALKAYKDRTADMSDKKKEKQGQRGNLVSNPEVLKAAFDSLEFSVKKGSMQLNKAPNASYEGLVASYGKINGSSGNYQPLRS